MKSITFLMALLATSVSFISCKKTEDVSVTSGVTFQLNVVNPSFEGTLTSATSRDAGSGATAFSADSRMGIFLEWDTAYMTVSKIKFEADKKENEQAKDTIQVLTEWKGPKNMDIWNVSPTFGAISLNPGYYDKIKVKIEATKADTGTTPTFFLSGVYTNSIGISTPIILRINENIVIEVKKENLTISASSSFTSLIKLRLNLLLTGVKQADFNAATSTNGIIIVSATSNTTLYNLFKNNLNTLSGEVQFSKR